MGMLRWHFGLLCYCLIVWELVASARIYALQALKMGEIDYAKEAMNQLFKLDRPLFAASKPVFDQELQRALARQKF